MPQIDVHSRSNASPQRVWNLLADVRWPMERRDPATEWVWMWGCVLHPGRCVGAADGEQ